MGSAWAVRSRTCSWLDILGCPFMLARMDLSAARRGQQGGRDSKSNDSPWIGFPKKGQCVSLKERPERVSHIPGKVDVAQMF